MFVQHGRGKTIRVWKLGARPGPNRIKKFYVDMALEHGFAAIGWASLGDLKAMSVERIYEQMRKHGYHPSRTKAEETWIFSHPKDGIKKNDLVLLYCEPSKVCIGSVTRTYFRIRRRSSSDFFSRDFGLDYAPHRLGVKWLFGKKRFLAKFWYWPQTVRLVDDHLLRKVPMSRDLRSFLRKYTNGAAGGRGPLPVKRFARLISLTQGGWGRNPPTTPYEAARRLFNGDLRYELTGQNKHLDLAEGQVLVFRFQGKLIGERVFDRWEDRSAGIMLCSGGSRYPIFLKASDYLSPGANLYLPFSKAKLERIRADAYKETGPYIQTGERESTTTHRIGQDEVREDALRRYGWKCCLCDIDAEPVLVAGHVKGWAEAKGPRGEPSNVVLMCSLHDSLFGKGLITLTPNNYSVRFSRDLSPEATKLLRKITLSFRRPSGGLPAARFLRWHNQRVFRN